jgi:thioredoxin-related protein
MSGETFSNAAVISYLNQNFVSVRINTDNEKKIAAKYRVRGIPVTHFLRSNGQSIGALPGYVSADRMLPLLKKVHGTP